MSNGGSLTFKVAEVVGLILLVLWVSGCAALALHVVETQLSAYRIFAVASWILLFWTGLVATALTITFPCRFIVTPGQHPLRGWVFAWFGVYHGVFAVLDLLLLRVIRGTFFMTALYRALGAKVGPGTIINSNQISDCHLVKIGSFVTIGADAVINPHSGERGHIVVEEIRIGHNVTIGQYAVILSGAVIEDDVVVGAHALVPKGARLVKGGTYVGVPARRLGVSEVVDLRD